MDILEILCRAFPDMCRGSQNGGDVAVTLAVTLAAIAFVFVFIVACRGGRERCPKCKKWFLKEEAFTDQVPTAGPDNKKHTYRQFYLTCGCGYSKESRKPELIT